MLKEGLTEALQTQGIKIWQFSLLEEPKEAFSLLNLEEQARAKRYYFAKHRRRFTVARAMLRLILSAYLQRPPQELEFFYQAKGKPYLHTDSNLEFNLSHSADLALLAIGKTHPLGIDLEFFSPRPYEDLAENLFSLEEIEELRRQPQDLKAACFFDFWAKKEAFIKVSGLGLSYPTKDFNVVNFAQKSEYLVFDPLHQSHWKLISFSPMKSCAAALCCHPSISHWEKIIIEPQAFL